MFVFGETPAQAARMGYDIAQQNRQALTRANELEADYAFRTNQMENAAAQNMANLARAQQQEQNALARESFMFGEQQKQQARQEAFAKMKFDLGRKDIDREFAFEEKQLKAQDQTDANEADNVGATIAEQLGRLAPAANAARQARDLAKAAVDQAWKNGRDAGYLFDEAAKKFVGEGRFGTADDYNREFQSARMNLKSAAEALMPLDAELKVAERQARQFKLIVGPDNVINPLTNKRYPVTVQPAPDAWTPPANAAATAQRSVTSRADMDRSSYGPDPVALTGISAELIRQRAAAGRELSNAEKAAAGSYFRGW